MKPIALISIFLILTFSAFAAGSDCVDSDNGMDVYTSGTVTIELGEFPDQCLNEKRLQEFYCEDNELAYDYFDCLGSCENGRCTDETPPPEACAEDWDCTPWSDCLDEKQRRTCTDKNDCGTENNRPNDIRDCTTTPEEPAKTSMKWNSTVIVTVAIIIIAIALVFFIRHRKKKSEPV